MAFKDNPYQKIDQDFLGQFFGILSKKQSYET